jgi:hypothetical protein
VYEHGALGLRRHRGRDAREIRRESGPDLRLHLRDRAAKVVLDDHRAGGFHDEVVAALLGLDAEPFEDHARHLQVLGHRVLDRDLTVRHRRSTDQ